MSSETVSDEERAGRLIKAIADANSGLEARDLLVHEFMEIRKMEAKNSAYAALGGAVGTLLLAGMTFAEIEETITTMLATVRANPTMVAQGGFDLYAQATHREPDPTKQ